MDTNKMWAEANVRGQSYQKKVKQIKAVGHNLLVQFSAAIKKKDAPAARDAEMKLVTLLNGSRAAKPAPKPAPAPVAKEPARMRAMPAAPKPDPRLPKVAGLLNHVVNCLPMLVHNLTTKQPDKAAELLKSIKEQMDDVLKCLPPDVTPVEPPSHAEHDPGMRNAYSPEM